MANNWEEVAAHQHGLLSRAQATELKLTRTQIQHRLKCGSWVRVLPSVYRAAAAPESWRQRLMAAYLWSDGKAVVAGRSAAALWELEGYWRGRVELCGYSDLSPPAGIAYRQVACLERADVTSCSGIRVTSVERTILDLTSLVPPRTLERTVDDALRKRQVTVDSLHRCVWRNGRRGREGIAHLAALVEERQHQRAPDSMLESDVAAMFREAGMPTPVKRYRVIESDHLIAEVDLAWPCQKVAVQVHGSSFHRQRRTWENDQRVENRLQLHGWFVAKITRRMLNEAPEQCVELLGRALAARSSG